VRVTHSAAGHMASEFHLIAGERDLGCFRLPVPGVHNILNAAAAVAIGLELEIPAETIREALAGFGGVERRFQVKGTAKGVTVVDDYGHHPTEIRATLSSARAGRFRHVHVLFQPHRYTRTQALMDDFARAFHQADTVHVTDIYPASEPPIEGVTSQALAEKLIAYGHRGARYAGSLDEGIASVLAAAESGDVIVTLGAGSISQAADRILHRLKGDA